MEASMASTAGKPIMSDEEYDELKAKLRNKNSKVVQQVCSNNRLLLQNTSGKSMQ